MLFELVKYPKIELGFLLVAGDVDLKHERGELVLPTDDEAWLVIWDRFTADARCLLDDIPHDLAPTITLLPLEAPVKLQFNVGGSPL